MRELRSGTLTGKSAAAVKTAAASAAAQARRGSGGPLMTRKTTPKLTPTIKRSDSDEDEKVLLDQELDLLFDNCTIDDSIEDQDIKTAPLYTREAYLSIGIDEDKSQYGVLGRILAVHEPSGVRVPEDPRLYVNTNAPFSALVCGVQGSGKSHTVSVMLENMLLPNVTRIGSCKKALASLVLHFSEGGPGARPCEAAWVGSAKENGIETPSVTVYVSKSSLSTMKKVYAPLGDNVTVRPLLFSQSELDAQAILSMMAVGSSRNAPLYMQSILSILRELGENFTYRAFLRYIEDAKRDMNSDQKGGLVQRLGLLESFVDTAHTRRDSLFEPGCLTIIDLSDPFIDPCSACSLFEIVTRLFIRAELGTSKVLVVDEAHKYLSANQGDVGLTKALTSLIRQQRHTAMRVILSTQEPTAVPHVLLDLCSIAIFHRFSSPAWWDAVARRICADVSNAEGFERVVKLKTGQALVLCPIGLGLFSTTRKTTSGAIVQGKLKLGHFGRRYMIIKTRQRVTVDGGASILALED